MGYKVYEVGNRWGGYGVPTICEYPSCNEEIDRGISYACGGEPFSEHGCDRYFCGKHLTYIGFDENEKQCKHENKCKCKWVELCERCEKHEAPFDYKPERPEWIKHLLTDSSWKQWRKENPDEVKKLKNPR
jgi:hypothetical protein